MTPDAEFDPGEDTFRLISLREEEATRRLLSFLVEVVDQLETLTIATKALLRGYLTLRSVYEVPGNPASHESAIQNGIDPTIQAGQEIDELKRLIATISDPTERLALLALSGFNEEDPR